MLRALPLLCSLSLVSSSLMAQDGYRLPPAEVVDLLTAPPAPRVQPAPDGAHMLLLQYEAMPTIADVSRPMLRLAGVRIDPAARGPFRTSLAVGVSLGEAGGEAISLELPEGARIASASWSHDSDHFVLQLITEAGTELWGGSSSAGTVARLLDGLNTVMISPSWLADGASLLCARVPEDQGPAPVTPTVPTGPVVQESAGRDTPLRTYQDLLTCPHDADLFDHHITAELCLVSMEGAVTSLGTERFAGASVSPDGAWLLETVLERPYSYVMPAYRFPRVVSVRPIDSRKARVLARKPLSEQVPIGGVETGARRFSWKASEGATLLWCEALDGGDPDREVPHRDRWLSLSAPFEARTLPVELLRVEHRARGVSCLADPRYLLTEEYDRDRRWTRTLLHDLDEGGLPAVLEDRSMRDRYGDPGTLLREAGPLGRSVVRVADGKLLRAGRGATPEGDRPFLASQPLEGGPITELWRCPEGRYEAVLDVLPGQPLLMLTSHETKTSPPNLRVRRLGAEDGEFVALTAFSDPTPQIRGISRQLVHYQRADGVPLSATLYLPADHEPGERLPLFVWAYPREYTDARTAGQVSGSEQRFTRIGGSSHLVLAAQGWAVLDGATMPIIGDAETMNDTFREQLVASAEAAIEFAVGAGFADRERTAVGGHSYGAFMTANLLAHSDLFRAGVARSGAYNRTLTPFGFQAERRTYWEAPDTYRAVSPFLNAELINEPLLLIHGEVDNNSGTFPMQSERLFQAIKGNGGTARLVMLPGESHGYRARESVMHVQAETIDWLQRFVASSSTD